MYSFVLRFYTLIRRLHLFQMVKQWNSTGKDDFGYYFAISSRRKISPNKNNSSFAMSRGFSYFYSVQWWNGRPIRQWWLEVIVEDESCPLGLPLCPFEIWKWTWIDTLTYYTTLITYLQLTIYSALSFSTRPYYCFWTLSLQIHSIYSVNQKKQKNHISQVKRYT